VLDLAISSSPNLDLVCDVNVENWWPCHLTLQVQIPSALRTVVSYEMAMNWSVSKFNSCSMLFSLISSQLECYCRSRSLFCSGTVHQLDNFWTSMGHMNIWWLIHLSGMKEFWRRRIVFVTSGNIAHFPRHVGFFPEMCAPPRRTMQM
jgi:hypothetical protein